ncbi:MAG: TRAP transporter large permease subunit [Bacillota bacterium]
MEWYVVLILLVGMLVILILSGLPVAFSFFIVNFAFMMILNDPAVGARVMVLSIYDSLTKFILAPVPLFVIMGELLFHSGLAVRSLDVLSKWLGRTPGRLSIMATGGGALLGMLSGSTMASTAVLSRSLVPEMQKRGYSPLMITGPIMASGGLAMMIPPSALAVILGSLGQISIAGLLIGGILPGFLMAVLYLVYIVCRCHFNPHLAPVYDIEHTPLKEKIFVFIRDVLPMGSLIFLVTGLILLGIATPTEAAGTGALGAFLLTFCYRRLNYDVLVRSLRGTLQVTGMAFLIIAGSAGFSQLIAFTGTGRGLIVFLMELQLSSIIVLIMMQVTLLILGTFMDQTSIMMITLPLFMPIVHAFGFDPVWFGILMLICLEIGLSTPPFGLILFVMKGTLPAGSNISMGQIYRSAMPFVLCDLISLLLIMVFPAIALWLPGFMAR